jgi:4-phospho-D-threonate 3-dehydrogenase / 4-phospho-D-erythronate 3-dehydrogenase
MNRLKIGISVGDINGIGLEVILKTLDDERITQLCTPVIYGSSKVLSYHKNIVNIGEINFHSIRDAQQIKIGEVNVVNCWQDNVRITLGKESEESGKFAYAALDRAVDDLNAGLIDALVTAPINKHAMQLAGFPHSGHTEFLASKAGAQDSLMMLVNEGLRVALASNHIPVSEISRKLNKDVILRKLGMLNQSLRMDFGIEKPKIAVLGLNPHAGDGGSIGKEEQQYIIPAIQEAKNKGIFAIGPYPADGFFGSGTFNHFDAVLAMYHDQGLVGFKSLSFESGVNFTAGLPFVRTSPDHGTAYNITGQNKASADSFREALFLAIDIVKNRSDYREMFANPLNPVNIEDFVGNEDETAALPDDSFEEFVPLSTSKYAKALIRESEDDEEDIAVPVHQPNEDDDDDDDDHFDHEVEKTFDNDDNFNDDGETL